MVKLAVTAEGQLVFSKDILTHLGITPGDQVVIEKLPGGRIQVSAACSAGRIADAFGFLKQDNGPSLSIDEINQITAEGWAGRR